MDEIEILEENKRKIVSYIESQKSLLTEPNHQSIWKANVSMKNSFYEFL